MSTIHRAHYARTLRTLAKKWKRTQSTEALGTVCGLLLVDAAAAIPATKMGAELSCVVSLYRPNPTMPHDSDRSLTAALLRRERKPNAHDLWTDVRGGSMRSHWVERLGDELQQPSSSQSFWSSDEFDHLLPPPLLGGLMPKWVGKSFCCFGDRDQGSLTCEFLADLFETTDAEDVGLAEAKQIAEELGLDPQRLRVFLSRYKEDHEECCTAITDRQQRSAGVLYYRQHVMPAIRRHFGLEI